MKIIIQRVNQASVSIEDDVVGSIEKGLVLLVGIAPEDTTEDIAYAVRKITSMRIFSDDEGKMNLSIQDIKGSVLSISDTKKGNRPAFTGAADPVKANQFYDIFNQELANHVSVETGQFGADMQVSLINDGPVTIVLDTKNK